MSVVLISKNKEEYILIPNEAIRVRVIANSDNINDIRVFYNTDLRSLRDFDREDEE